MRNLKKLLALTLAMVMAFSLMLTANAAVKYDDYTDKDSITDEFTEAVQVLTGLEVMQGDEKGFRPSDKITRAEAAAVIYRAVTGDVTNKQNDLYKDYGTFTDVKSDDWFAGYVGYCQNAGYIKGTSPTTFNPYGQVTGYEVLAMILRAVGYGKNNEFTGSSWQVNVAALARQLGVTRNVTAAHMEQTLNMAAPREVVADLVFMTIATVPTVTYTPALAYNDKQSVAGADSNIYNITLGQQVFGLFHDVEWRVIDDWGNPGYRWRSNGVWNGATVTGPLNGKGYMIPANHPWYTAGPDTKTVATIEQAPDYETTKQVLECDVAAALEEKGFDDEETFRLYVNQDTALTNTYRVVATDTVTRVGGQGRLTKVYFEMENPWFTDDQNNHDMVVTMVDTMLARVTAKTDAKLDPAGHIITPAQLEVIIYDGMDTTFVAGTTNPQNAQSNRTISKPSDSKDNWEYSVGDHILLNAYTNKIQNDGIGTRAPGFTAPATAAVADLGNNTVRNTQDLLERAAFQTNKVVMGTGANNVLEQDDNVWVLKVADSKQGKQTVTYWNQGKHQMDGTDYDDQICLFLDRAGRTTNTTFTWYFDQYGNLIGIGDAHAVNYGVITSVYSAQAQGETDTTGGVKAVANVRYADGTTGTVEINRFLVSYGTTALPAVAPGTAGPTVYRATAGTLLGNGAALTAPYTPAVNQNTVELRPVFDNGTFPAMASAVPNPVYTQTTGIAAPGWLYMSPSTSTNTNAHFATNSVDVFGILYNNLFRFTVADDNSVVATEVAGQYTNGGGAVGTYDNTNVHFQNMANDAAVANDKLFKTLGYMLVDGKYVYLNSDANIMVKLGSDAAARTINCYNGLSELPGDVNFVTGAEIDWADTDGDNRADVVYIANGTMPSTITYGLFYYNGGAAIWDGTSRTGTIAGYLNGEAKTITFSNRDQFAVVQNSANYNAHLFALQLTNDVVSNVMASENSSYVANNHFQEILSSEAAVRVGGAIVNANGVILDFDPAPDNDGLAENIKTFSTAGGWTWAGATEFGLGTRNGNPYTETTEAIYLRDAGGAADNVTYQRVSNGHRITVTGAGAGEYYLAPNCVIVGELDWLNTAELANDVTMVYDTTAANAVTEIYISRDPDVTPVGRRFTTVTGPAESPAFTVATQAALDALVNSGVGNRVAYSTAARCTGLSATYAGTAVRDILYFPFTAPGGVPCTLTVTDSTGAPVYTVTGTPGAGADYYAINLGTSGAVDPVTSWNANSASGFGVGTYSYSLMAGTTPLSTGTFTLS